MPREKPPFEQLRRRYQAARNRAARTRRRDSNYPVLPRGTVIQSQWGAKWYGRIWLHAHVQMYQNTCLVYLVRTRCTHYGEPHRKPITKHVHAWAAKPMASLHPRYTEPYLLAHELDSMDRLNPPEGWRTVYDEEMERIKSDESELLAATLAERRTPTR